MSLELFRERARSLTNQQRELARSLATGHSLKEAAELMHISIHTAEKHRERAMHTLGINKATQLVHVAIATGLVPVTLPSPTPAHRAPVD